MCVQWNRKERAAEGVKKLLDEEETFLFSIDYSEEWGEEAEAAKIDNGRFENNKKARGGIVWEVFLDWIWQNC